MRATHLFSVVLLTGLTAWGPANTHVVMRADTVELTAGAATVSPALVGRRDRPRFRQSADRFVDLDWLDSRRGWALVSTVCGNTGARCAGVYGTRTSGRRWTRLTPVDAFGCARSSKCVTGLRFITPRIGYLYGRASFMTTDGGRTWKPSAGPQVESIAFSGGAVFRLVYHGTGCPGPCAIALQRSQPGAQIWTTVGHWPNATGFGEQLFAGGANLYVIFYGHIAGGEPSAHATIDLSPDRGRTWSARSDPCGGSGVHEDDAVAAAAAGGVFSVLCVPRSGKARAFTALSRNAGRTFTAGAPVRLSAAAQLAVAADGPIAVGNGGVTGGGNFDYELALSGDGGRTWRVAIRDRERLAEDLEAGSLQFVGPRGLFWVGSPYFAWRSLDAGKTWQKSLAP